MNKHEILRRTQNDRSWIPACAGMTLLRQGYGRARQKYLSSCYLVAFTGKMVVDCVL